MDPFNDTPQEYIKHGLWLLWRGFKDEIRETWQEAHRLTYGDGCLHPRALWNKEQSTPWRISCGVCGRRAKTRSVMLDINNGTRLAYWWLPEQERDVICYVLPGDSRVYETLDDTEYERITGNKLPRPLDESGKEIKKASRYISGTAVVCGHYDAVLHRASCARIIKVRLRQAIRRWRIWKRESNLAKLRKLRD